MNTPPEFDMVYRGMPARLFLSSAECKRVQAQLARDGWSYTTIIAPPRGTTHRRPKAVPRRIIVGLLGEPGDKT